MTTRSILKYALPLLALVLALAFAPLAASASTVRIYVTNSAGDSIDVIDPVTNKVVQKIKDVVGAHGIAFSPDATRVYVSNEETSTLDVFDRKSGKLIKKVALSDHPNNISVTKNGDRIVVAIARGKGGLDIVDAATLTLKKTISANGGRLHNVYVTPDNKYVVGGSIPQHTFYVFDLEQGAVGLGDADGQRRALHGDRNQPGRLDQACVLADVGTSTASRSSISPSKWRPPE